MPFYILISYGLFWIVPIFSLFFTVKYTRNFKSYLFVLLTFFLQFIYFHNFIPVKPKQEVDINIKSDLTQGQYSTTFIGTINNQNYLVKLDKNESLTYSHVLHGKIDEINTIDSSFNNSSSFDARKYYASKKVFYQIELKNYTTSINNNLSNTLKDAREKFLHRDFKSKHLINALVWGKKDFEDFENQLLINTGVIHLFTISGLHISLIIGLLILILNIFKLSPIFQQIIIALSSYFYLILSGINIPVFRAIALAFNKHVLKLDQNNFIIYLLFILIIINPFIVYSSSFLLTFGIYIIITNTQNFDKFKLSFLLFLVPLCITINFNYQVNFFTPIINLILTPVVICIYLPLSFLLTFFPLSFFDKLLFDLHHFIINILTFFNYFTISVGQFGFIKLQLLAFMIYFFYHHKKMIPTICYLWCLCFFSIKIHKNEFYFIDVGQGDSMLLTTNFRTKNYLIDTGNEFAKDEVTKKLASLQIDCIEALFITHFDKDHCANIDWLNQMFTIKHIITSDSSYNSPFITCISKIFTTKLGNLNLVLIPPQKNYEDINNNSLVMIIYSNNISLFLTGDIESDREMELVNLLPEFHPTILKAPHHGSKTSSSEIFLHHFLPQYIIISSGKNNIYHHPSSEVISRYKSLNLAYYDTQTCGEIHFSL